MFQSGQKKVVGADRLCYYAVCLPRLGLPHIVATGCQPQNGTVRRTPTEAGAIKAPDGVEVCLRWGPPAVFERLTDFQRVRFRVSGAHRLEERVAYPVANLLFAGGTNNGSG